MKGFTTIQLRNTTKNILVKMGKKNQSYDDVIRQVLRQTGVI